MMRGKKKEYQKVKEEEWIEMEDLSQPNNQDLSKKLAALEAKELYHRFQQQEVIEDSQINLYKEKPFPLSTREPLTNKQNIQPIPQAHFIKKQPSMPMMEATCDFCTVVQSVPGNTQVFICGSCENMNECYPLYGAFICGCCQSKVGFGFGMSEYIRCPKCSSVNKVPLEPVKGYESLPVSAPIPRNRLNQRQSERQLQGGRRAPLQPSQNEYFGEWQERPY